MIDSQLILLEGPPGSGKSTISKRLYDHIGLENKRLVQESTHPHPIAETCSADIGAWQAKTLRNWERFAAQAGPRPGITVVEAGLLQNTVGQMLLNNASQDQIAHFCQAITTRILSLSPILIRYTAANPAAFLRETYTLRGAAWQNAIDHLIAGTPYGQKRNLSGYAGFAAFYSEYLSIADAVYHSLELKRASIDVTSRDWPVIERQTCEFLQIEPGPQSTR